MSARTAAIVLTGLGLLNMVASLADLGPVAGVAAATGASPRPRVFTAVDGLETYATAFFLEWSDSEGHAHSLALTPEVYTRLRGPYNRRNAYGAAVAYAPILHADARTRRMWSLVSGHGLGGARPVLRELGIDPTTVRGPVRLRLVPRRALDPSRPHRLELEAPE